MNQSTHNSSYFWALFLSLGILLFFRLGATPIYILDEAKNAECAREMMLRNDWIVPTFNGILRTDKPPLHYFFMVIAYRAMGVSEFSARFFSALMGLLTVLITYLYIKRLQNGFAAFCSCVVLICSSHFLFEFRLAVPDPYLIFFVSLGLFSAYTWLYENKVSQLYIAAAAFGFATLAKGPVALALPGLCLLIWVIISKKWATVFNWHIVPASILLAVITLPWYLMVDRSTNGEWTKGFFIDQNLNRFSSPQEGHGGFFLMTILFVIIGLLPFMSFIGEVIKQRRIVFQNSFVRFSGIVVLVFVAFFSISSTKLPNYPMPCYPFAAVVLGSFVSSLLNGQARSKNYPYIFLVIFTLLVPVAGYFAIAGETEASSVKWIAWILLVGSCPLIACLFVKTGWEKKVKAIFWGFAVFNVIGLGFVYPVLYSQNPVFKTLDTVRQYTNVYSYEVFNPGYRFYLNKDIPTTNNIDTLKHWLDSTHNAIVISTTENIDSLRRLPLTEIAKHHDLFELPTTVILKNNEQP